MPSLDRFTAESAGLLVVDVQTKLEARMRYGPLMVANSVRLIEAARLLEIPAWATEQYPEGLGPSVPEVAGLLPACGSKRCFHCCEIPELVEQLHGRGIRQVTMAGIETHVCVAQTALELLRMGFQVQVPADSVASRGKMDWKFALRRMEHAGVVVSTTEAVLFEWLGTADHPRFKAVSALVKDFREPEPRRIEGAGV